MSKFTSVFPLSSLVLAMSVAHQSVAADPDVHETEQLVVWGTEVKASSVALDEQAIDIRQADHISDLLRTIPGVDVGGAHSLNQRITIRSMDDKDLRISIDGANQNTYMYHHMGNLQIHADILQSVDVEVGTNSVINGGLGGAVRFETKSARHLLKPGETMGARVQASYADNAGDSLALIGYGQFNDNLDYLLYHNSVGRDNYQVGGGKIKDATGAEVAGTHGEVEGLEGDLRDSLIKLGWDMADNQRFELGYEMYVDKGQYSYRPDMGLATDLAIGQSLDAPLVWPTEFTRNTLTLNYDAEFGNTFLKAAIFDNKSHLERDETAWQYSTALVRGSPASAWAAWVNGDADNRGITLLAETIWEQNTFTYGFEHYSYKTHYEATYLSGSLESSKEDAKSTSLFLQDRIQLTDELAVIPGLRYDNYNMNTVTVDDSFDDVTGALALEYALNNAWLFKISQTQLFKAPEVAEVFVGAGLFDSPNPDLKAETGKNSELSMAYADAVLGADRFAAGFTYFQTLVDDYIYDYAGSSFKDNVGDMTIDGYEAYLGYNVGGLKALLTFSKADSKLDAFAAYAADLDGARIDRQQGDTISLALDYTFDTRGLSLHWDVLTVDDVPARLDLDGATQDNAKEGFTVHNVSARWSPEKVKGLTLTAGIDNVTDEFYASQSSRTGTSFHPLFGELYLLDYEPGRNVKFTVAYEL